MMKMITMMIKMMNDDDDDDDDNFVSALRRLSSLANPTSLFSVRCLETRLFQ